MDSSNVSVSGGYLNLALTSSGTGGLVSTNPSGGASPGFQFTYGYAEARIYLLVSVSANPIHICDLVSTPFRIQT